ncbi:unnamed protein product, partial [Peniophora sp. CBMAI 1063]
IDMANPSGKTAVAGPSKNGPPQNRKKDFVVLTLLPPETVPRSQAKPNQVPRNVLAPRNQAVIKQELGDGGCVLPRSRSPLATELADVDSRIRRFLEEHAMPLPKTPGPAAALDRLAEFIAQRASGIAKLRGQLTKSRKRRQKTTKRFDEKAARLGEELVEKTEKLAEIEREAQASSAAKDEELGKVSTELALTRKANLSERLARDSLQTDLANEQRTTTVMGQTSRQEVEAERQRSRDNLGYFENFLAEAMERAPAVLSP